MVIGVVNLIKNFFDEYVMNFRYFLEEYNKFLGFGDNIFENWSFCKVFGSNLNIVYNFLYKNYVMGEDGRNIEWLKNVDGRMFIVLLVN